MNVWPKPPFVWIGVMLVCVGSAWKSGAGEGSSPTQTTRPVEAPKMLSAIVLEDQFERNHRYTFPMTQPTVVLVADKEGYASLAPWIEAVRDHAGRDAHIVGIADLRGVPGFLHGKVRRKFRSGQRQPVLLAWNGELLDRLDPEKGVPNVYLISGEGNVVLHLRGPATAVNLEKLQRRLGSLSSARPSASLSGCPPGSSR